MAFGAGASLAVRPDACVAKHTVSFHKTYHKVKWDVFQSIRWKLYVPTAPKVPDAGQFAIESIFAPIKRKYASLLQEYADITTSEMVWAIEQAFSQVATPANIRNCFEHCEGNMQIFCGTENEIVTVGNVKYHCKHGKWLPKDRRG